MKPTVVDKYLARYAEPEHRIAARVGGRWRHVLVVPAVRESALLLDGLKVCARAEALVILVVNARDDDPRAHAENAELLRALGGEEISRAPSALLARHSGIDLLIVDRSSPGARLPPKQGVGLARRIGADLALALGAAGKLAARFIATTDADAELPEDYFSAQCEDSEDTVALTYPFTHVASGDALTDRATELYDQSLRHYVDGLSRARSPYAFHTIGSALAVRADAYAAVRGFPRRLGGEDFYLIDKLAKLGTVRPAQSQPIRIRARRSDRAPFGTGPAVERYRALIERGEAPSFYDPRCFDLLSTWLSALDAFAEHRDPSRLRSALEAEPVLRAALDELGAVEAALRESAQAPDALRLRRRLHTSFGALKTLRLVHGVARRLQPKSSRVVPD